MSVPIEIVLILALGLLTAAASIVVAGRLASQLREAQARLLNEVTAREKAVLKLEEHDAQKARLLEDHETSAARIVEEHEAANARLIEARDALKTRAEAAEASLSAARAEASEARDAVAPLRIESERGAFALAAAKAAEATALARVKELSKTVDDLREVAAAREAEVSAAREIVAKAKGEVSVAESELRRTTERLAASQREASALGERAARLEAQLFEALAASKLEKQLLETLGAVQASGAELARSLQKAEGDAWREKTAKDASLLEARALREDVKRVQMRLAGEIARREELARQWASAKAARDAQGDAASAAPAGAERRPDEMDELMTALSPPPIPSSDEPASAPLAARSVRPKTAMPTSKKPPAPPEEPKKIASWWCQICGRGGTQLASACKHQWKNNEMV